jgi:hypothetical protein
MRHEDVTFTWSESDPRRPALAVLLRLIALTDHAYDDGDLTPYLMRPEPDAAWTLTLTLPSTLRSSYQFCPVRDPGLADRLGRNGLSERTGGRSWRSVSPTRGARPRSNPGPSTATRPGRRPLWSYSTHRHSRGDRPVPVCREAG